MELDPAIEEALEAIMAGHPDQSDTFKRRYRTLVELALTGNYQDADVRRVMELLSVSLEGDE